MSDGKDRQQSDGGLFDQGVFLSSRRSLTVLLNYSFQHIGDRLKSNVEFNLQTYFEIFDPAFPIESVIVSPIDKLSNHAWLNFQSLNGKLFSQYRYYTPKINACTRELMNIINIASNCITTLAAHSP